MSKRQWGRSLLLSLLAGIVVIGLLEAGVRGFASESVIEPDPHLGWRVKRDYDVVLTQTSSRGRSYEVQFTTNGMGFRTYATPGADPLRVLVLGDSFTMDPSASNEDMWFARFADEATEALKRPVSVFALGAGGYGTLQELLVARSAMLEDVNLFLLQVCDNDLFENNKVFNTDILPVGSLVGRPFLAPGDVNAIVYDESIQARVARWGVTWSRLGTKLLGVYVAHRAQIAFDQAGTERLDWLVANLLAQDMERGGDRWASGSFAVTEALLEQIRDLYPDDVPALALSCQVTAPWLADRWEGMVLGAGFQGLLWPAKDVWSAAEEGVDVLLADGYHWSDQGNDVFGRAAWRAAMPLLGTLGE